VLIIEIVDNNSYTWRKVVNEGEVEYNECVATCWRWNWICMRGQRESEGRLHPPLPALAVELCNCRMGLPLAARQAFHYKEAHPY
jgi:hypothetical protein